MKKTLLQLFLTALTLGAAFMLYKTLNAPIEFTKTLDERSAAIIEKLKDIRTIERAYKVKYGSYTGDFDELVRFIKHDSLVYEVASGSEDDSVAVAEGRVTSMQVLMAARDTLFSGRTVNFDEIALVPYANGQKFSLGVSNITTESGVEVNVFEASVEYEAFLSDLPGAKQDIINLKDKRKTESRYPGIKVGSLEKANNDAGSWEN